MSDGQSIMEWLMIPWLEPGSRAWLYDEETLIPLYFGVKDRRSWLAIHQGTQRPLLGFWRSGLLTNPFTGRAMRFNPVKDWLAELKEVDVGYRLIRHPEPPPREDVSLDELEDLYKNLDSLYLLASVRG